MLRDSFAYTQIEVFRPEHLRERCDAARARAVVTDFLDTAPQGLVRLARAVTAGDAAGARQEAHALKRAAQTLGAEGLVWVSLDLEETARRGALSSALLGRIDSEFRRVQTRMEAYLSEYSNESLRAA